MKRLFSTFAVLATLMAGAVSAETTLNNEDLSLIPEVQTEQITEVIVAEFKDLGPQAVKKMISIADCESYGGRDGLLMHIGPEGELVENSDPKSSAAGVFQTLLITHGPKAQELGLDLTHVTDNVRYARYLVDSRRKRGLNPYGDWVCA